MREKGRYLTLSPMTKGPSPTEKPQNVKMTLNFLFYLNLIHSLSFICLEPDWMCKRINDNIFSKVEHSYVRR